MTSWSRSILAAAVGTVPVGFAILAACGGSKALSASAGDSSNDSGPFRSLVDSTLVLEPSRDGEPALELIHIPCNDGGAEDVPLLCPPAERARCLDAGALVFYRMLNWTCDPGGECLVERVVMQCGVPPFANCREEDGEATCPSFLTP